MRKNAGFFLFITLIFCLIFQEVSYGAVPVNSLTINYKSLHMVVGDKPILLKVKILPKNATNRKIIWTSSNSKVATVNKGLVKPVGEGTSIVIASTQDKKRKIYCKVYVKKNVQVERIELKENGIELNIDAEPVDIRPQIYPLNATDKRLIMESSNPEVAEVIDGSVFPISPGQTTITVSSYNKKVLATCKVTVLDNNLMPDEPKEIPTQSISLNKSNLELKVGDQAYQLVSSILPLGATTKELIWTSSNPDIASVDKGLVKPIKPGSSTITVKVLGTNIYATCNVNVLDNPIQSISLNKATLDLQVGDESYQLITNISPTNATTKEFIWTSSNLDIATVDNGLIKPIKPGITIITVKVKDTNIIATCTVNVKKRVLTTTEIGKRSNAVVYIETDIGQGSGFIISSDGKVVTNYHVIEKGKIIKITLQDGRVYSDVKILGYNKEQDIAVLKLNATNLPFLELGDSDNIEIGNDIVTIGSPEGLKNTLSTGVISGIRENYIQISAPISHGSSGGALFNMFGEVIGITSAGILNGENLGFAIPINMLKKLPLNMNLSIQELYQIEYPPTLSYAEFTKQLYSKYGTITLSNGTKIYFDRANLDESENIPDQLYLFFYVDTDNMATILESFNNGYEEELLEAFSDILFEVKDYYNDKKVYADFVFSDLWNVYPSELETNKITIIDTVKYDSYTNKWFIWYPVLELFSEPNSNKYTYIWGW